MAEGTGLLNRRTSIRGTAGSNPALSAFESHCGPALPAGLLATDSPKRDRISPSGRSMRAGGLARPVRFSTKKPFFHRRIRLVASITDRYILAHVWWERGSPFKTKKGFNKCQP